MEKRPFKFYFKRGPITVWAFTEENAKILAQAEAIKQGWDPTIISKSEADEINKRQYISLLDELKTLPVPGTILYTPNNTQGYKLVCYQIDEQRIEAIVESHISGLEIYWTLEQVRQCTWDKIKGGE